MNCDNCTAALEADHPGTDYQFDNVLWLKYEGGYGMFTDELSDQLDIAAEVQGGNISIRNPIDFDSWTQDQKDEYQRRIDKLNRVVLCHECAHKLCDLFPAFSKAINPHNSHSHRADYRDAHPDHFGWDYDRHAQET